jgi:MFS family permease
VQLYGRILRAPRLAPLIASTLLARLPIGINGLAIVLFLRAQHGSFSVAGAAAGALALGTGLGAPWCARAIDAFGPRVLLALAAFHATGLVAVIALGTAGAPGAALVAAAFVTGAALPPTSSVMRRLYPTLLAGEPDLIQGAYALDSVLTETIFILGPLLTAAAMALIAPAAALVLSGAAVVSGCALFNAALPREEARAHIGRERPASRLGALASPGIRTLVLSMLPVGLGLGALEVALPAFADHEGHRELAGLLIAVWSIGSAAGGFVYGIRPRRSPLADVHLRIATLVPLGFAPVVLATSPITMALLVIPAGVFVAPLIASRNELAGRVAPDSALTEAYSWPLTAMVAGVAIGAGIAGTLVDQAGWRAAVLLAPAAAALGAAISLTRRGTLAPVTSRW